MEDKCDCYRIESKRKYTYNPVTRELDRQNITVGVCWGTKEIDECNCNGDRTKCDFYPELRENAKKELEKAITNADCIRTMTDDELAEFLLNCANNDIDFCHVGMCLDRETCIECALKWLRQSIKE